MFVLLLVVVVLLLDVLAGGDVDLFHLNVNPGDVGGTVDVFCFFLSAIKACK